MGAHNQEPDSKRAEHEEGRTERVEAAFFGGLDPSAIAIFGVGEPWRGDDAVGPWLAGLLERRGFPARALGRDGFALMEAWSDRVAVVVIDAIVAGGAPGQVRAIDGLTDDIPLEPAVSTHHFGLADAIAMGRALGKLPSRLLIYGIEGGSFELGQAPGRPVKRGAVRVSRRLAALL